VAELIDLDTLFTNVLCKLTTDIDIHNNHSC